MGKGTDALNELRNLPPQTSEESYRGTLPLLRIKPELVVEPPEQGEIIKALAALNEKRVRNVLVRDSGSGFEGVVVPVERYVELVGKELQSSRLRDAMPDGRLLPSGLVDSDVEMIDPHAVWPSGR